MAASAMETMNNAVGAPATLEQLLEAGVHFGHQKRRWNPKMRPFIFGERNGIHIIDLRKTLDRLEAAKEAARKAVTAGGQVLFLSTKRQPRAEVEQAAKRSGSPYVTERWLGGMLTNFNTIRRQIRRMKELERGEAENAFEFYTKKEQLLLRRERSKLANYFNGVRDMARLPALLFVVDAKREIIGVREANRLKIPVIAIADTNANPDRLDYPIPGNDDAIAPVKLISSQIADAILEAKRQLPDRDRQRHLDREATIYSTETGEKTADARETPRRRPARRKRRPRPEAIAEARKVKK